MKKLPICPHCGGRIYVKSHWHGGETLLFLCWDCGKEIKLTIEEEQLVLDQTEEIL